jgi:hypothetical protein
VGDCMLIHAFSSNLVDILVYLLYTYLEQIIVVEGTEEACNGKIKETRKDLMSTLRLTSFPVLVLGNV